MKKEKKFFLKRVFDFILDKPLRWWDFLVPAVILVFCFLSYEMRDLYHTAGCSYGFLDGHFLDFYDYLSEYAINEEGTIGLHASYMPTIYLLFAIWNIPMKLLGIVPSATALLGFIPIMWAKILPCLAHLGSGIIFFKICKELKMENRKAKLCTYAYLTMPVALFVQFVIGQYESFTVFCMLMGLYYWLKKKDIGFVLWFALAVTFKITVIVFFIPLLMLREKNIWKILLYCVGVLAFFILEFAVFMHSPTFMAYAFGIGSSGDAPTGYIFNAAIYTGYNFGESMKFVVYLTVVAFAFVCAYAYFKISSQEEESRYALYILCLAGAALFCFSKWHPQWLMLVVPFWTITAFQHRNTKVFMALDLMFGVLFVMFVVCQFAYICDEIMLKNGIFKFILPDGTLSNATAMSEYLGKLDMSLELSLMTAIIGINAVFKHPKYLTASNGLTRDTSMGWIRARYILPLLLFIIPSLLCVKSTIQPPLTAYLEERRAIFVEVKDDIEYTQEFTSAGTKLNKIKFPVSRGENMTSLDLTVSVSDPAGNILYSKTISTGSYMEGELVVLKPGISVEPGQTYTVHFSAPSATKKSTICLLGFSDDTYRNANKGELELDYHLNMNIYQ